MASAEILFNLRTIMDTREIELGILESLSASDATLRQRDIAKIFGVSVGMTNALVKRLSRKGWLSIRKINNRNIRYLATPKGIEMLAQRSYGYLKRIVRNIVRYKGAIDLLVERNIRRGARGVELIGHSDLDFIIAHICSERHIPLKNRPIQKPRMGRKGWLTIYSEDRPPPKRWIQADNAGGMTVYLREFLVQPVQTLEKGG